MVNYQDPTIIMDDALVVSKLWHAVAGLYFWEFVATLDYEWGVIRRRRPYPWTFWVYFTTRISTLMAVILALVGNNVTARYNCAVETVFELIFGYLAVAAASLLIVLRVVAIWNKTKIIVAIATGVWVTNVIAQIQAIVRIRAKWITEADACVVLNLRITQLNILVSLGTDIILLLIMFFGLLRLGFHERSAFALGRLVWKQGVIWLLAAAIAEVLPAVFISLNLNDPFNYMFLLPAMVTLSIAATRIYRSLADYAYVGGTEQYDLTPFHSSQRLTVIDAVG
ncbi:hypothetical protein BGY98DRAFT_1094148 [Russula aff. rugulosa BPL654]|nr:hypothetical protein BGY98DRAFT_1094148 [Russula aff. rugulosa BPL654]